MLPTVPVTMVTSSVSPSSRAIAARTASASPTASAGSGSSPSCSAGAWAKLTTGTCSEVQGRREKQIEPADEPAHPHAPPTTCCPHFRLTLPPSLSLPPVIFCAGTWRRMMAKSACSSSRSVGQPTALAWEGGLPPPWPQGECLSCWGSA